ncbi:hypothetical protein RJ639_017761 [Escallonia herrerae]|uniref:BSD domain-containing protein n=1 Tax=Escallonia herrerae TaxID=1293975 RepID=A0AA89AKR7_9ASTE|nr:hypothetical protein RJ639_017761 [Escallonia herrerae]
MDFFKSILSEDPNPQSPDNHPGSDPNRPTAQSQTQHDVVDAGRGSEPESNPNSSDGGGGSGWNFGGLFKTITTRSESVLETYRRDLKEFGSGLKNETSLLRAAASRAVKELPASIEVGASAAQGSIQTVLKSTASIISQGKDNLLAPSNIEFDQSEIGSNSNRGVDSKRYSRYEAQLNVIRSDVNTYIEEPEDLDDFNKWKSGFMLEEKSEEVENLIKNNAVMEGIYKKVVPNEVDRDTFWCRYFYRVHKLKLQEDLRANLVRRAISIDYDEELSWDIEEDDDEEANVGLQGNALEKEEVGSKDFPEIVKGESSNDDSQSGSSRVVDEDGEKKSNVASLEEVSVVEPSGNDASNEEVRSERTAEVSNNESESKSDPKVASDAKSDNVESCKDSDVSVVSTQPSLAEEEELGWDEIEDLGSNDEKKFSNSGSPNRADLRKRLSAAEEDEDLSWDIEDDDDEPMRS